jgi:hypothetical protein
MPDTQARPRTLRLVALGATIGVAGVLAITALVLAQATPPYPPATARTVIVTSAMVRPDAETTAPPQPKAVRRSFPAAGITKLVLRAGGADKATVATGARGSAIEVSGIPAGGAAGYHSPDPKWRETPAAAWGLDFVSVQRGPILVVSTKNEMQYIHHHYAFASVAVRVPPGVEVFKEPRVLTGDGAPDLH